MIANIETCFWALHKSQFLNRHECAVLKIKPGGRTLYFLRKKKIWKIREDSQDSQYQDIISPQHYFTKFRE